MNLRVVFDTNIFISAVGWGGTPKKCVDLVRTGRVDGLICVEILEELGEKLSVKFGQSDAEIGVILGSLIAVFELVAITGTLTETQADPKDDKILECAVIGRATHVVTGDKKHLVSLRRFRDVEIVTPAELIRIAE